MENKDENEYNKERKDRELLLFDKGFTKLPYNEKNKKINKGSNNLKKKNINWFTVYLVLFKNTLSSKNLVPKEELKLRLNIIRKYLPPYLNCQKGIENSNTSSIMKKFTYHLYSKNNNLMAKLKEKKSDNVITLFEEEENENGNSILENNQPQTFERKKQKTKTQKISLPNLNLYFLNQKKNIYISKLKTISEIDTNSKDLLFKRSPEKKFTLKSGKSFDDKKLFLSPRKEERRRISNSNLRFLRNEKNVKFKFDKKTCDLNNNILKNDKEIIIRTPNDKEFPLILTEKRLINNNNQTYFFNFLNKLNEETKNEKITTYKNEVNSQILRFNEMYFDTKMDDFSQDNLFNELKNTCDMFINKFNCDNQEEKNLADLDKFL